MPALADEHVRRGFLVALAETGVIRRACDAVGINHLTYYRHKLRDPAFGELVDGAVREHQRQRSAGILDMVQDHVTSHLEHSWEYERDESGELMLDNEFELVRRSTISVRSLTELSREARAGAGDKDGGGVTVSTNVATTASAVATAGPEPVLRGARLVHDDFFGDDAVDAEFVVVADATAEHGEPGDEP
ncbi:MAG: hypothetical protein AAGK21_03955 [Bacteroidota bacterium]